MSKRDSLILRADVDFVKMVRKIARDNEISIKKATKMILKNMQKSKINGKKIVLDEVTF